MRGGEAKRENERKQTSSSRERRGGGVTTEKPLDVVALRNAFIHVSPARSCRKRKNTKTGGCEQKNENIREAREKRKRTGVRASCG
jgi:hypothetical protein